MSALAVISILRGRVAFANFSATPARRCRGVRSNGDAVSRCARWRPGP